MYTDEKWCHNTSDTFSFILVVVVNNAHVICGILATEKVAE